MNHQLNTLTLNNGNMPVKINYLQTKKAALILRALNHKLRYQILKLLDDNKRIPVTEIYVKLRIEQSVASQHLAILRRAGIVKTERTGKFIFYSPDYARIDEVMKLAASMAE
jgi:DNA-binding transcriptional ArsR family regulator